MKYQITWSEVKKQGETNGKPWSISSMTLKDESGKITDKVDTFDTIVTGAFIEGEIETGKYGLNFKKSATPKQVAGANFKTAQIEKTMERKEKSISGFQDNKERSIKVSSTLRDAVTLAVAEGKPTPENILKWRTWLLNNWDIDPTDTPPFE